MLLPTCCRITRSGNMLFFHLPISLLWCFFKSSQYSHLFFLRGYFQGKEVTVMQAEYISRLSHSVMTAGLRGYWKP